MSRLGFSQLLCFFKQFRFSSFYFSLSAFITFLPSTFLYLHLLPLFLLPFFIYIYFMVLSLLHLLLLFLLPFFICIYFMAFSLLLELQRNKKVNEPFRVSTAVVCLQTTQVFFLLPFFICIYYFSLIPTRTCSGFEVGSCNVTLHSLLCTQSLQSLESSHSSIHW